MIEQNTESSRGRQSKVSRLIDEYDLDGLGEEMARRWTAEDDPISPTRLVHQVHGR